MNHTSVGAAGNGRLDAPKAAKQPLPAVAYGAASCPCQDAFHNGTPAGRYDPSPLSTTQSAQQDDYLYAMSEGLYRPQPSRLRLVGATPKRGCQRMDSAQRREPERKPFSPVRHCLGLQGTIVVPVGGQKPGDSSRNHTLRFLVGVCSPIEIKKPGQRRQLDEMD